METVMTYSRKLIQFWTKRLFVHYYFDFHNVKKDFLQSFSMTEEA